MSEAFLSGNITFVKYSLGLVGGEINFSGLFLDPPIGGKAS